MRGAVRATASSRTRRVDARQRGELLAHEPQRLEPRKVRKLRRHAVEPAHVAHEHTQPLEPADHGRELATAAFSALHDFNTRLEPRQQT